jgi:hypothetical protein
MYILHTNSDGRPGTSFILHISIARAWDTDTEVYTDRNSSAAGVGSNQGSNIKQWHIEKKESIERGRRNSSG